MIKVNVYYPYSDGATFDMDYYATKHIPMVQERTGAACKGVSVESGLAGGTPGQPPTFIAIGSLLFDSVEEFQGAFGPHAGEIMGDIPNYTAITPIIQISDVVSGG
jgi:uncharacterized protein (TIGR02118 family)